MKMNKTIGWLVILCVSILLVVPGKGEAARFLAQGLTKTGISMVQGLELFRAAMPGTPEPILEEIVRRMRKFGDSEYSHVLEQICLGKAPEDPQYLCNWVCTVARNYCVDQWRKWKNDNPNLSISVEDSLDDMVDPPNSSIVSLAEKLNFMRSRTSISARGIFAGKTKTMEEQQDDRKLDECIENVVGELEAVGPLLEMRLHLVSYKDIATKLNLPEGTVKSKIARVRKKLREKCGAYY